MTLPILRNAGLPVQRVQNGRGTALSPWNPWQEISELSRWFDDFMGRSFDVSPNNNPVLNAPGVDMYETPDELVVFAYVPGAKKDGFDISLTANTLTLKGERQPLIEGENLTGYGTGIARSQGTFETQFRLPIEVDTTGVKASYHEGVLEIHLPKAESAKRHCVKVEVESL